MGLTIRRGVVSGALYVAFNEKGSATSQWIGGDEDEAAAFMETHPECRVFGLSASRSNLFEVERVPPVPATVRPIVRDDVAAPEG